MYVIKGFAPHARFADLIQFPDGMIGRPTTLTATFAKSKRVFVNRQTSPNTSVLVFEYLKDGTPSPVEQAVQDHTLEIINYVYDYTISRPGIQIDHAEILNKLIDTFGGTDESFEAGKIVTEGQYSVPEYVGWKSRSDASLFTIWLSDQAFQRQYPNYDITVIPPIWNENSQYPADEFFKPGALVVQALKDVTMTIMAQRMQTAKQKYPETVIDIPSYMYIDPNDGTRQTPAFFGLLFYGMAGFNLDSSKDAIQKLLLENSNRPREDWVKILPDLFRRTEFLILPMWEKMAIPASQHNEGLHSSQVNHKEVVPWVSRWAIDYQAQHIQAHASVTGWPWRSMAMCSIGNQENRDGKFELVDYYPDWLAVPNTSTDFSRMSIATRKWAETIHDMIFKAETFGPFDVAPDGYTKTIRDGVLYLSTSINNVQYNVLCKHNTL